MNRSAMESRAKPQRTQPMPRVDAPRAIESVPAISCANVSKEYYFFAHRPRKVKEAVFQFLTRTLPPKRQPVWAIQDFNLAVYPGETVGVVGHNGAGKSTLLKLLSRILVPTKGTIH